MSATPARHKHVGSFLGRQTHGCAGVRNVGWHRLRRKQALWRELDEGRGGTCLGIYAELSGNCTTITCEDWESGFCVKGGGGGCVGLWVLAMDGGSLQLVHTWGHLEAK